jgi:hypothetical protein
MLIHTSYLNGPDSETDAYQDTDRYSILTSRDPCKQFLCRVRTALHRLLIAV